MMVYRVLDAARSRFVNFGRNLTITSQSVALVATMTVGVPADLESMWALPDSSLTADNSQRLLPRTSSATCPEGDVCIGVNVANRLDVALAVGSTDVDRPTETWPEGYPDEPDRNIKYFEKDLRELLSGMPKPVVKADLIVDAVEGAATSGEFTWWTYDHTRPRTSEYAINFVQAANVYDDATHTYIEAPKANYTTGALIGYLRVGTTVGEAPGVWGPGLPTSVSSVSNTNTDTITVTGVGTLPAYAPGIGYQYLDINPGCTNAGFYPTNSTSTSSTYPNGLSGRSICDPQLNPDRNNPDLSYFNGSNARRLYHPYQGNSTHLISSKDGARVENGDTMDFYGYPNFAYRDWKYLEDNQKTLKTFEFSIAEDRAFDALDGTGFFFNTEINGRYCDGGSQSAGNKCSKASGGQTMSGYLLFLQYSNAGVGESITLYKFRDIDTRLFHDNNDSSTSTATVSAFNTAKMVAVAKSTSYDPGHFSRRIKLVAGPDDIKVYYNGSTARNDSTVLDPKNLNYVKLDKSKLVTFTYETDWATTNLISSSVNSTVTLTAITNRAPGVGDIVKSSNSSSNGQFGRIVEVTNQSSRTVVVEPVASTTTVIKTAEQYIGPDKANDKDFGFGPMAAYRNHTCARPTHIALQNISMSVVKPLETVVRQPRWRDGTYKYLVNLNENPIKDFDDPIITGELLNRLRNDNIHYIGWTGNVNALKSIDFLVKNELKGLVVNIEKNPPAKCVPYSSLVWPEWLNTDVLCVSVVQLQGNGNVDDEATYNLAMQIIAQKVYQYYYRNNEDDIVLTTDDVVLDVEGAPVADTADDQALCALSGCDYPDGRWKIVHRQGGVRPESNGTIDPTFENWEGHHLAAGEMPDLDLKFNRPGYYDIYYENRYLKTVIAHRPPVANFKVELNGAVPTFTSLSYDLDDYVLGSTDLAATSMTIRGIQAEKWQFLDLTSPNCPARASAGTQFTNDPCDGQPSTLVDKHNYLIYLTVTDNFGAESTYSQQVRYLANPLPSDISPPVAFLEITPTTILLGVEDAATHIVLENNSYDPHGTVPTSVYSLTKDGVNYPSFTFQTGSNDVSSLPAGEYVIKLVVKNQHCTVNAVVAGPPRLDPTLCKQSAEVTKTFTVLRDEMPPTAEMVPPSPASVLKAEAWDHPIPVQIRFSDLGGSEFKEQRVIVTRDRINPGSDGTFWTAWSDNPIRNTSVKIASDDGVWICWQAKDFANNVGADCFGPYFLELQVIGLVLSANPNLQTRSGDPVTLTAVLDHDDATGAVYFYDYLPPDCPNTGSPVGVGIINADIAAFTYSPPPGPKTYLARYCGDSQYDKATNSLSYRVTAPDLMTSIVATPKDPNVGDVVAVRLTVSNIGNQAVNDAVAELKLPSGIVPFGNIAPVPSQCATGTNANNGTCINYDDVMGVWTWQVGYLAEPVLAKAKATVANPANSANVIIYGLVTGGNGTISGGARTALTEYDWNNNSSLALGNNSAHLTLGLASALPPGADPFDVMVGERAARCLALDLLQNGAGGAGGSGG